MNTPLSICGQIRRNEVKTYNWILEMGEDTCVVNPGYDFENALVRREK